MTEERPSTWPAVFFRFFYLQILCSIFPLSLFATFALSPFVEIPFLHRYDFILLCCLAIQAVMVRLRLETMDEVKVICVFHAIGLLMELYKTSIGAWSYPEEAYTKIGPVPLYSGFMYASVASYMCQAWRRFDLHIDKPPPASVMLPVAAAIYINFFTNRIAFDLRWILAVVVLFAFWRTHVYYTVLERRLKMPMCLSFFLIGLFVWVAENIVTYLRGWQYPHQAAGWTFVELQKLTSWVLLVIVSFVLVSLLKAVKTSGTSREQAL